MINARCAVNHFQRMNQESAGQHCYEANDGTHKDQE